MQTDLLSTANRKGKLRLETGHWQEKLIHFQIIENFKAAWLCQIIT